MKTSLNILKILGLIILLAAFITGSIIIFKDHAIIRSNDEYIKYLKTANSQGVTGFTINTYQSLQLIEQALAASATTKAK